MVSVRNKKNYHQKLLLSRALSGFFESNTKILVYVIIPVTLWQ